jgi:hypothetical protein
LAGFQNNDFDLIANIGIVSCKNGINYNYYYNGSEKKVIINAISKINKKILAEYIFIIRNIPVPEIIINENNCNILTLNDISESTRLLIENYDIEYLKNYRIISFDLTISNELDTVSFSNKGNRFDKKILDYISMNKQKSMTLNFTNIIISNDSQKSISKIKDKCFTILEI